MKKIVSMLALIATATMVHAQGTVYLYSFAGSMTTNSATSIYAGGSGNGGTSGAISSAANGFYFTLLISSSNPGTSNPLNASWSQAIYAGSPVIGTNYSGLAGDMQGPAGTTTTAIDNWGAGATESFIVVGWSASLGSSWLAVSNSLASGFAGNSTAGFFGASAVGTGASGVPPTGTPLNILASTGTFSMYAVPVVPVPEPATLALAGLGGLSMLLFRRKKA